MKTLFTWFLLFFAGGLLAQPPHKEFSNWIFANNHVFHFPDSVSDPIINNDPSLGLDYTLLNNNIHFPITTCVSDSNGKLLFYTSDSGKIWNRNMQPMKGSEVIAAYSEAFRVAVKKPNSSQYYLGSVNNLVASIPLWEGKSFIVDMSLDGGLGGVIVDSSTYFPFFYDFINHPSGRFVWLLRGVASRPDSTVYLYAYKLTENGVDTAAKVASPVISYPNNGLVGSAIKIDNLEGLNCTISHDGKFLIINWVGIRNALPDVYGNLIYPDNRSLLLDFDIETGIASNPRQILTHYFPGYSQPPISSIEFSPSSNFFYCSFNLYGHPELGLYQCPVTIDKDTFFTQACVRIDHDSFDYDFFPNFSDIKLASNGKMYVTKYTTYKDGIIYNDSALSVIHNPDLYGNSCNFKYLDIPLADKNLYYLPNKVLPSLYFPQIKSAGDCEGDSISFQMTYSDYDSIAWDWGDGSRTVSASDTVKHVYHAAGSYIVSARHYLGNKQDTTSYHKEIVSITPLQLGKDTLLCAGSTLLLNARHTDYSTYLWSNDSTTSQLLISEEGTYRLEVASAKHCKSSDSIFVGFVNCDISYQNICLSDSLYASFTHSADSIVWDFGDNTTKHSVEQTTSHKYTQAGSYTLSATMYYKGVSMKREALVEVFALPDQTTLEMQPVAGCAPLTVDFKINTQYPHGYSYTLEYGTDDMTTGDETGTMHRYTYAQAGKYIPTLSLVTDKGCKAEIQGDTVAIYPKPSARFTFQPTSPNMDSPFVSFQNLSTGASSFIWEIEPFGKFTSQAPQVEYTDTGYYTATLIAVSTYGCSDTAQTEIYIRNNYRVFLPNAFSPNGDGLNDIFKPIVRGFDKLDFRIYNRWGELIFHTLKDEGWDGTYQGQAVPSGVYSFTLQVLSIYGEMQYFTGEVSVMR